MTVITYLLATRSQGKLRELRELFAQLVPSGGGEAGLGEVAGIGGDDAGKGVSSVVESIRVIDLDEAGYPETPEEEAIECYDTFEENACAKAEYFHRLTGLPTFADDSGLVVHALQGAPGVRSKRWSGRSDLSGVELDAANNLKLLSALSSLPAGMVPSAEYVCAAAFADSERTTVTLGRAAGVLVTSPAGNHGFGYDPYFRSSELGKSFAEATVQEKRKVSHRGRAFRSLVERMFGPLVISG